MEKYCTIAILVCLGSPLFARGLIILESDASLQAESEGDISTVFGSSDYSSKNPISADESIKSGAPIINREPNGEVDSSVFENQEANHDFTSSDEISADGRESIKSGAPIINRESKDEVASPVFENQDASHDFTSSDEISADGRESIKSGSLIINREPNGEVASPVFENQDANHDFASSDEISADAHVSIKSVPMNIDGKTNDEDVEVNTPGVENQDESHDFTLSSPVSADGHESIKSGHLNIDGKSNEKSVEAVSPMSENKDANHDHALSSQISTGGHESVNGWSLNIGENSSYRNDQITVSGFENNTDYGDYPLENIIDAVGHEMVESDPVTEKIPEDIEFVYQINRKRHVPERGFTEETKKLMLDLHNVYRGNVTPPAGDMNFLEWDENLEHLAQLWADNCVFAHGRPAGTKYELEGKVYPYGQNLYIGTDPSGYKSLWMWYEEYMHYDLRNQTCKPFEQCGHYVQMAWAESKRLGCGIRLCGMRYLIVCHYYPGAIKGSQMFQVGRPCSLCNEEDGALCKNKLCVSHELCKRRPNICESAKCSLRCQNCGRLNKTSCTCTCADGWDSPDCSKLCEDEHVRCGMKPGFPSKAACSINHYAVAKKYCRKMCDTCASVTTDSTVNHLCCEGKPCEKGYVLDLERKPCKCTLLCPGPLCDYTDDKSSALNYNFIHLISQILVFYFMNYINHSL